MLYSIQFIADSAAASSTPPQPPITSTGSGHKMDVNDFVRAAEIDPVLIKILLVKPKKRINQMLKKIAMEQAVS